MRTEKAASLRMKKVRCPALDLSLLLSLSDEAFGVFGLHEGFTAENRIGSRFSYPPGIFRLKYAALTDFDDLIRDEREKVFGGR